MPLDKKHLLSLCARIAHLKSKDLNEEDTRVILIDPMLQALGWNIFNFDEISRNSRTSSGGYVDYILKYNGSQIYLEAKSLRSKLLQKYQIQTTNYAYEDNIDYCVLTNGNCYQIFETFKRGTVSERLLIDISLDDEKISIENKVKYLNFISKESLRKGNQGCKNNSLLHNKSSQSYRILELKDLFLSLRQKILSLGKDIKEIFYHQHNAIGFKRNTEFTIINIKPKNKEIVLLLKFGEVNPNLEKLKNVKIESLPNTYRNVKYNYKVKISKKEQINEIIDLITQCYNLQSKRLNF